MSETTRQSAGSLPKRQLGRTGLMVSEIGLGGAWYLGRRGDAPADAGVALIRGALAQGVTFLDTAECYIEGRSEAILGEALEGYTGECVVATKFGHRPADFDFSRESVLTSIAESRRLLRGHPIDLIQIHTPAEPAWDQLFGPGGALEGMEEARQRGWCRWFGITGNDVPFLQRCIETDHFDTLLMFLRYDLLDQTGESLLTEAQARGIGVLIGSPLRMGLLGSARAEMVPRASDEERRRLEQMEARFAGEPGGLTAAAYRFILARPEVSVVLTGASSLEELTEVLAVVREPRVSGE